MLATVGFFKKIISRPLKLVYINIYIVPKSIHHLHLNMGLCCPMKSYQNECFVNTIDFLIPDETLVAGTSDGSVFSQMYASTSH